MKNRDTLTVRMLGGFSVFWQGEEISVGGRDSQFARLMEILLHYSDDGVPREKLEEMLFADSHSADRNHMLRSVIYNARKKLEKAGLPGAEGIIFSGGIYRWTKDIPVEEDARQFEETVNKAEQAEDPGEKADLYQQAGFLYLGEFLPHQATSLWALQEQQRYRELFCRSMEHAAALCREHGDFETMQKLGLHASKVQPFSEWEAITMEALLGMDRFDEASELYEQTADHYLEELGIRPAFAKMNAIEQLTAGMENLYGMLDDIQAALETPKEERGGGGFVCSLPVFQGIYRMFERMIDRSGQSVFLMLCTIVNGKGHHMKEGAVLDRLSQRLGEAVRASVRHSDVVCRYSKSQYLVLLINTTREDCAIVQKRIDSRFKTEGQRTGIMYHVNGVDGKYL